MVNGSSAGTTCRLSSGTPGAPLARMYGCELVAAWQRLNTSLALMPGLGLHDGAGGRVVGLAGACRGVVLSSVQPASRAMPNSVAAPTPPGAALKPVSYTHLRAHETDSYLVCRLLLEKKKI